RQHKCFTHVFYTTINIVNVLRDKFPTSLQVKPVIVLPQVGKNLQDHAVVTLTPFTVTDLSVTWSLQKNLSFSEIDQLLYEGKGPAIFTGSNGFGYIVSDRAKRENPNWSDLQISFINQMRDGSALGGIVGLTRPYSRGTLRFNTSATSMEDDNLVISDPRYFTHPGDLDRLLEGIQFIFKVLEGTQAFKKIGTKYAGEPIQECKHTIFRSKDYWACYIEHRTTSVWHSSCTCGMGKQNDRDGSVVDSKLRVHGIKKLRIIDASVMPQVTNANTVTPVIVIAEKTVDSIIKEYAFKKNSSSRKS
ncbi:unnamed protein product, partial [Allacma fusca]